MQVPAARILFSDNDKQEISQRITTALSTGALTLGENTREFEAAFAEAHCAPYAVAVSSGTAALEIILRCIGCRRSRRHRAVEHLLRHGGGRDLRRRPTRLRRRRPRHASRSAPPPSKPLSPRTPRPWSSSTSAGSSRPTRSTPPPTVRPSAASSSSRTPHTPTARSYDGRHAGSFGVARRVLVLPHQGHHQR